MNLSESVSNIYKNTKINPKNKKNENWQIFNHYVLKSSHNMLSAPHMKCLAQKTSTRNVKFAFKILMDKLR